MSLWAKDSNGNAVFITDNGVSKGSTSDMVYCPSCGAKMWFKSQSSNARTAHFAAHHEEGCDIGLTYANEHIYEYRFTQNTLHDFLHNLIKEGVKLPSHSSSLRTTQTKTTNNTTVEKKDLKTLRQLHNVLASAFPEDELYAGKKVKEIYCGINTSNLYTKFISGLKLVFAQFRWYKEDKNILCFHYPSEKKLQVQVFVSFKNAEDLHSFVKNNGKKNIHHFFIIFAEFTNSRCTIDSLTQIVHLHKQN